MGFVFDNFSMVSRLLPCNFGKKVGLVSSTEGLTLVTLHGIEEVKCYMFMFLIENFIYGMKTRVKSIN